MLPEGSVSARLLGLQKAYMSSTGYMYGEGHHDMYATSTVQCKMREIRTKSSLKGAKISLKIQIDMYCTCTV